MDKKKVKEAIEELKSLLYIRKRTLEALPDSARKSSIYNNEIVALETAIEALEKQLPKKVEIEAWCPSYCPSCGNELSEDLRDGYYKHPNFIKRCPNSDCAQLLDWSE